MALVYYYDVDHADVKTRRKKGGTVSQLFECYMNFVVVLVSI